MHACQPRVGHDNPENLERGGITRERNKVTGHGDDRVAAESKLNAYEWLKFDTQDLDAPPLAKPPDGGQRAPVPHQLAPRANG